MKIFISLIEKNGLWQGFKVSHLSNNFPMCSVCVSRCVDNLVGIATYTDRKSDICPGHSTSKARRIWLVEANETYQWTVNNMPKMCLRPYLHRGVETTCHLCNVMTAGQEVQHAFHHPASVRLARMYSGANNYSELLTLGDWKRKS